MSLTLKLKDFEIEKDEEIEIEIEDEDGNEEDDDNILRKSGPVSDTAPSNTDNTVPKYEFQEIDEH